MGRLTDAEMAILSSRFAGFNPPIAMVKQQMISDVEFPRDDWDVGIYYSAIVQDPDGTFRMLYTAYRDETTYGPAIATSSDLINWTKPNIGEITFGGNTNNNLIITMGAFQGVDLSLVDGLYIALINNEADLETRIYTSTDGENFTYSSTPASVAGHGYMEAKSLLYVDGVYRLYYRQGVLQTRSIGYYESTSLAGTYVDKGQIPALLYEDQDNQFYDFQTWLYAGQAWGCCPKYNKTTEVLGPLMLYGSADGGQEWNYQGNIIENGASGEWDDELLAVGRPMLISGEWKMVYSGSSEGHDTWIRPMHFGLATL